MNWYKIAQENTNLPPSVIDAFNDLAHQQRTKPERYVSSRKSQISQLFNYDMMHCQDIIHRMSESVFFLEGGMDNVEKKVRRLISSLHRDSEWMPWLEEVKQQVESNRKFREKQGINDELYYYKDLIQYGKEWANEMAQLPVYNELQYHAREAAINLGNLRVDESLKHLYKINDALEEGPEKYTKRVIEYNLDKDNNISQYHPEEQTK